MNNQYQHLFTPIQIGNTTIKNRIFMPPLSTNLADKGYVTDALVKHYEARAKGGVGLIVTEVTTVEPTYTYLPGDMSIYDDSYIPGWKKLVDAVHRYDTKILSQLFHPAYMAFPIPGTPQLIAPSNVGPYYAKSAPREVTKEELKVLVKQFGEAALRFKKAGGDGVEIQAAHAHGLLGGFLTPLYNKRTDEYGGCLDNRVRIIKEVLDEMRAQVGDDFPIMIRFSANEDMPGARDMAETRVLAKLFEEWGFNALHVSSGVYGDYNRGIVSPMYESHAWTVDYAEEVKKIVNIPVITVNRINDPRMADGVIAMGKADFVGMGRGSLADPNLPNKAKAGHLCDIRYCIGCLQGCTGALYTGGPVTCLVNPSVGLEYQTDYSLVKNPKRIAVIGAGPAGLTTAITAARRGHQVTIYEAKDRTGGQFISAAFPPCKGEFTTFISWANKQLNDYGVNVLLNTKATVEMLKAQNYDEVVVATGGVPFVPPIKGIDLPHVHFAEDVLVGKDAVGDQCVVAGGGEVGCETAAHLGMVEKGATIVEMKPVLMEELDGVNKEKLFGILNRFHVQSYTSTKVLEIKEHSVLVETPDGQKELPCDSVVLAMGYKPNHQLADELEQAGIKVHIIAGATKTSNALVANAEGFKLGLEL